MPQFGALLTNDPDPDPDRCFVYFFSLSINHKRMTLVDGHIRV